MLFTVRSLSLTTVTHNWRQSRLLGGREWRLIRCLCVWVSSSLFKKNQKLLPSFAFPCLNPSCVMENEAEALSHSTACQPRCSFWFLYQLGKQILQSLVWVIPYFSMYRKLCGDFFFCNTCCMSKCFEAYVDLWVAPRKPSGVFFFYTLLHPHMITCSPLMAC